MSGTTVFGRWWKSDRCRDNRINDSNRSCYCPDACLMRYNVKCLCWRHFEGANSFFCRVLNNSAKMLISLSTRFLLKPVLMINDPIVIFQFWYHKLPRCEPFTEFFVHLHVRKTENTVVMEAGIIYSNLSDVSLPRNGGIDTLTENEMVFYLPIYERR